MFTACPAQGPTRSLTLHIHAGVDTTGAEIAKLEKSFGCSECCCCRPSYVIKDGQDHPLGARSPSVKLGTPCLLYHHARKCVVSVSVASCTPCTFVGAQVRSKTRAAAA